MQVWVNLVRANGFDPKKIPGRRKLFNEVGVELNPPDFDHRARFTFVRRVRPFAFANRICFAIDGVN